MGLNGMRAVLPCSPIPLKCIATLVLNRQSDKRGAVYRPEKSRRRMEDCPAMFGKPVDWGGENLANLPDPQLSTVQDFGPKVCSPVGVVNRADFQWYVRQEVVRR